MIGVYTHIQRDDYLQVIYDRADIGAMFFSVKSDKDDIPFTFGPSNFPFAYNILGARPTPTKPLLNIIRPFPFGVYVALVIQFLVGLVASIIIFKYYEMKHPIWFIIVSAVAHGITHLIGT